MKKDKQGELLVYLTEEMGISKRHAKMEGLLEIINAPLTFAEYEEIVELTAIYPDKGKNLIYPLISLAEEVGEVCQVLAKAIRDKNNVLDETDTAKFKKEMGDVLWQLSALAHELGLTLEEVASTNYEKLLSRVKRGTLGGSGDDR